jgi:hypothetical protein
MTEKISEMDQVLALRELVEISGINNIRDLRNFLKASGLTAEDIARLDLSELLTNN